MLLLAPSLGAAEVLGVNLGLFDGLSVVWISGTFRVDFFLNVFPKPILVFLVVALPSVPPIKVFVDRDGAKV